MEIIWILNAMLCYICEYYNIRIQIYLIAFYITTTNYAKFKGKKYQKRNSMATNQGIKFSFDLWMQYKCSFKNLQIKAIFNIFKFSTVCIRRY